jgi:Protein of unknown function (DUF2796)
MKRKIGFALLALAAGAAPFAASFASAGEAHQHGSAQLSAAIDGNMLELEFSSPLENLVGFEHQPRNERERQAMQAMKERFNSPQALFVPTPAAGCQAGPAELVLPEAQRSGGHADLHAVASFRCATPAALRSIELRLFEAFPRLQRVRVQLAAPGRQAGADLSRQKPRLDW